MKRRSFIRKSTILSASGLLAPLVSRSSPLVSNTLSNHQIRPDIEKIEILYNGIRLPGVWPPQNMSPDSYEPMPVPYLENPPRVIPIIVGRQLFVDDFLIESTNLRRKFHKARKYEGNPVLFLETELEMGNEGLPVACPKDGGIWWDPAVGNKAQLYNLSAVAYESIMLGLHEIHLGPENPVCQKNGFPKTTELMVSFSRDGFHWHRPDREAFIPATRKEGDWERGSVRQVYLT